MQNPSQIDKLLLHFEKSFEDGAFSRNEARAIKEIIQDNLLEAQESHLIRSRVFDLAREKSKNYPAAQVIDWLERAIKTLPDPDHKPDTVKSSVNFSPGMNCLNAILQQFALARKSADICVFTITDNRITRAISECFERGVNVRIITDNDKALDDGSDVRQLERRGIAVRYDRTSDHMHHKFAVLDGQVLLTGSFNWTRSATDYNHENIVTTNDFGIVRLFAEEFEKLWKKFDSD